MELQFSWFCPSYGPGRNGQDTRYSLNEVFDIAKLAELNGIEGILTPADSNCYDPWMLSTGILNCTKKLRVIIAVRTGFLHPVYTARMLTTLDQISAGRVQLNIVTGGSPHELAKEGSELDYVTRYQRTAEFVEVLSKLLQASEPVNFQGKHYQIRNSTLYPTYYLNPPRYYVAGSSNYALEIAHSFGGTPLIWVEPMNSLISYLERCKNFGRVERKGLRLNILIRDSCEDALSEIKNSVERNSINGLKEKRLQELLIKYSDSTGVKKMAEYAKKNELYDGNLWVSSSGGMTGNVPYLVGNESQVKCALQTYISLGFTDFILSSINHKEIVSIGKMIRSLS